MPLFSHYGVQLWVPEVGGPIDPDNEAHELVMSVFGGMSKGERNRIKIRVRTAMASQTEFEGRYLGGRPPYGYTLTDLGRHPNPAKAAEGKRLHGLAPDPQTSPIVQQIFDLYLADTASSPSPKPAPATTSPAHPPRPRAQPPPGRAGLVERRRVILANRRYIVAALRDAEPEHKLDVYRNVGLRLTYDPETRTVPADIDLAKHHWASVRVR
jgi:site-specific DNA recombinase